MSVVEGAPVAYENPALPEPDLFERVVTLVDAAAADRGWHAPHLLVRLESAGDSGTFDLGLKELPDGSHPVDELWGFEAPSSWMALGVVSYGWAAPEGSLRPAHHPLRTRVRATLLMTRTGRQVATASLEDGTVVDEPAEGLLDDVLRRCLGVATPPPPPIGELAAVLWLDALLRESRVRTLTWSAAEALRPPFGASGSLESWREVRRSAARSGRWPLAASWMDDGFFARELLARFPRVDQTLEELDARLPPSTALAVRRHVATLLGRRAATTPRPRSRG